MVIKKVEPPTEIIELIKKEDFGYSRKRKSTKPYVTDVIFCCRKAVYNRFFEKETDLDKMTKLGRGIAVELYNLRKLPPEKKQVRFENDYFVGKLDGIITRDGADIGVEIKQSIFGSETPSDYFVDQCTIYSSMTGMKILLWVSNVIFNYKVPSKVTPDKMVGAQKYDHASFYEVSFDAKNEADKIFMEQMKERSRLIQECLLEKKLPPKSPRYDFECKGCDHAAMCEKDEFPIEGGKQQ